MYINFAVLNCGGMDKAAYKPDEEIIVNIDDAIDIDIMIRPIFNFKTLNNL